MLILSRHEGQRILIGSGPRKIVITLVESSNGGSRIGITAPRDIVVLREEIADRPPNKRCCDGSGCPACSVPPADV